MDIVPPEGDQQALAELAHRAQREIVTAIRQAIEQATDGLGPHLRRGILDGCRLLIPAADEELTRWRRALLSDLERPADELLDDVYDIYAWLAAFAQRLGSTTVPGNQLLFSSGDNFAAQVAALDAQTVAAETAAAFESNRLTLTAGRVVAVSTPGVFWTIQDAGVTFTIELDAAVLQVYATPLAEAIKVRRDLSSALNALLDLNVDDETGALIAKFGELVQSSQLLNTCMAAIEAAGSPENIRAAAAGLLAKLAKGAEKLPGFATAANLATFLDRFEAPALKSKLLGMIEGVDSPITPLSPGGLK